MFTIDEILAELRKGTDVDSLGEKLAKELTNNLNAAKETYEQEKSNHDQEVRDAAWDLIDAYYDYFSLLGLDTSFLDDLTDEDIDEVTKYIVSTYKSFSSLRKASSSDDEILSRFINAFLN